MFGFFTSTILPSTPTNRALKNKMKQQQKKPQQQQKTPKPAEHSDVALGSSSPMKGWLIFSLPTHITGIEKNSH